MEKLIADPSGLYKGNKPQLCYGRSQRLLTPQEYTSVFDNNNFRASHKHALMLARLNEKKIGRLGLVISKKNVRRSVDRNRIKRITREYFRLQQKYFLGLDAIVLAKPGLATIDNKDIVAIMARLIENIQQQHFRKMNS